MHVFKHKKVKENNVLKFFVSKSLMSFRQFCDKNLFSKACFFTQEYNSERSQKFHVLDSRQSTNLSTRSFLLCRAGLQHLVHIRAHYSIHRHPDRQGVPRVASQLDRLRRYPEFSQRHASPVLFQ